MFTKIIQANNRASKKSPQKICVDPLDCKVHLRYAKPDANPTSFTDDDTIIITVIKTKHTQTHKYYLLFLHTSTDNRLASKSPSTCTSPIITIIRFKKIIIIRTVWYSRV